MPGRFQRPGTPNVPAFEKELYTLVELLMTIDG
jgi:hypothetical protein